MNTGTRTHQIHKPSRLKSRINPRFSRLAIGAGLLALALFSAPLYAANEGIASKTADVDGLRIHYLTAGQALQ